MANPAAPKRFHGLRGSRGALALFFRAESGRQGRVVLFLLLAGLVESLGLASLLPLLTLAGGDSGFKMTSVEVYLRHGFEAVGLPLTIPALAAVIALAMILKAALTLYAMNEVGYAVADVGTRLRQHLLERLLEVRWGYFTRQPVGRFANAISNEANRAGSAYLSAAMVMSSVLQSALYLGLAFLVSWEVALGSAAFGGLIGVALNQLVRRSRVAGNKQTQRSVELVSQLTDALTGIKPLKAMGRHSHIVGVLFRKVVLLNKAMQRQVLYQQALKNLQEPLLAILVLGGFVLAHSIFALPLAQIIVIGALLVKTISTMNKVHLYMQNAAQTEAAFWHVHDLIEETRAERERFEGRMAPTLERGMKLEGVSMAFGEKEVLDNVDLEVPAGRLVTLMGSSGGGKTTITDLVLGLHHPTAGRILIDGHPLSEIDIGAWRDMVGYVPQELFLFHDSILANITLGDETIPRAAVEEALRSAGAADFVAALPEGVDTVVGERGSLLSGGQRQRIALARALVRKPKLLILDEVTSALDPVTEQEICTRIRALVGPVTVLAITHQRAWVDMADVVYRVGGQTVQEVTPAAVHGEA